jgi:hypothetical protein
MPQAAPARVRIADGAPVLETLINGVPQDIGAAYLQVDGATVVSSFAYGTITSFFDVAAGAHSLVARDTLGYAVGPLKTSSLSPGGRYTLVVVGSYPNYQVLTFNEPKSTGKAQLSLYEASPAVPQAAFGRFRASSRSGFQQLGSAHFGSLATVSMGKSVTNLGGYVGSPPHCNPPSQPPNCITPVQLDSFDSRNALPFHNIGRLSLFLFDVKTGSAGPVFGSLDP